MMSRLLKTTAAHIARTFIRGRRKDPKIEHRKGPQCRPLLERPWQIEHDKQATAEDIYYCFRLLLGRSPHRSEWPGHVSRVGEDLHSVVASYLNSYEFAEHNRTHYSIPEDLRLGKVESFSIWADTNDLAVGRHVLSGSYEPHVTQVFKEALAPGKRVVDVGANIGYFSLLAARLVGAEGLVLAMEPSENNVKLIEASRRQNQFDQLRIVQAAAGRDLGLLSYHPDHSNGLSERLPEDSARLLATETVACLPVDCLVPAGRTIDLMKVDVEGAEHNVFLGAREMISRCRPLLVWEFTPQSLWGVSQIHWRDHLTWVQDLGYQLQICHRHGNRQSCDRAEEVYEVLEELGVDHLDLLAVPR